MEPSYVLVEKYPQYEINREGDIRHIETKKTVAMWRNKDKGNRLFALVKNSEGKGRTVGVSFLLGCAFVPKPDDYKDGRYWIYHKDEDSSNMAIDNLYWGFRHEKQNKQYKNNFIELATKFEVPTFNAENDGYFPNPVECRFKKDFYYLPDCRRPIVISKNGELFDLDKDDYCSQYEREGYRYVNIYWKDRYNTVYVHRLVGLMFVPKPDRHGNIPFSELEINHKDGNKQYNYYKNLEWVTPKENIQHAIENNLKRFTKVLAKDIRTEKITTYKSLAECAREHGLSKPVLEKRLYNGKAAILTKFWHVFKFDDGSAWPKLKDYQNVETRWYIFTGIWYACNEEGHLTLADYREDLEILLGIKIPTGVSYIKPKQVGKWLVTYDEDPPLDVYLKLNPHGAKKIRQPKHVRVLNTLTMETEMYYSLKDAAEATGISPTTLSNRLIRYSGKWFNQPYLYEELNY